MKLYGSYTSPFVRHCRIVLLETNLACEFIETDLAGSATQSPTKRVPFLKDDKQFFTDSSSIIKYLREKAGKTFCVSAAELDQYCMVNTLLDTSVNLFLIGRDGFNIETIPYLQRQAARIEALVDELDHLALPLNAPYNDAQLRLACYIGWAKFRNLFNFEKYPNLEDFFAAIQTYENFKITAPKN